MIKAVTDGKFQNPEPHLTCEQRRDLLLLYATDALDADEAAEMRRHLQSGCPQCAGYLAEAQALVASLPLALESVFPPPHLKENLMQRITTDELGHSPRLAARAPTRWIHYLVPAALAAGLGIAVTHSLMIQQVKDLQRLANISQQSADEAMTQVRQLREQFQSQTQVVEMLQSPDVKLISLKPTQLQPNAVANLLWDQRHQQWAILTSGMAPAAAGQTYELWFITQTGAKVAAGTFEVDNKGAGSLRVAIPPGIGALKLAAVTNEKVGGVPQPQGSVQMAGGLE